MLVFCLPLGVCDTLFLLDVLFSFTVWELLLFCIFELCADRLLFRPVGDGNIRAAMNSVISAARRGKRKKQAIVRQDWLSKRVNRRIVTDAKKKRMIRA